MVEYILLKAKNREQAEQELKILYPGLFGRVDPFQYHDEWYVPANWRRVQGCEK